MFYANPADALVRTHTSSPDYFTREILATRMCRQTAIYYRPTLTTLMTFSYVAWTQTQEMWYDTTSTLKLD